MKQILLCCLMGCISIVRSQTLTQSFNEPHPGDIESTYNLDTSAYTSGLPISVTGSNVVWNFSNLKAMQPQMDSYYLGAASVSPAANYSGCNLVQESNQVYTYFKSSTTPTTQTELLGVSSSSFSTKFSDPGIIVKYPVSYGYNSADNMSGTFNFSVQGNCSGNITTTADGLGTLNLPGGVTLTSVLRVRSVQNLTLTFLAQPIGTVKQTIYNFYHSSKKFPVLSITYLLFDIGGSPTNSGNATGSIAYFVTGLEENSLSSSDIRIYPNPANGSLVLEPKNGLEPKELVMYNNLGQITLRSPGISVLDLQTLQSGVYTLEIITDKGTMRKKIIKE